MKFQILQRYPLASVLYSLHTVITEKRFYNFKDCVPQAYGILTLFGHYFT